MPTEMKGLSLSFCNLDQFLTRTQYSLAQGKALHNFAKLKG